MKERPHRKLLAWQKGMELYVAIFTTTKVFPREEIYGVTSQMPAGCALRAFEPRRRRGKMLQTGIPSLPFKRRGIP